jgi:phospholipid/cholesterol/gamma-HCH transport system substrate-binding protein
MQRNSAYKSRLGIFVFTGILLLLAAIYYIGKRQQLFGQTFRISGIFSDVNGLQVGNNVRFSGITVGTIEDIEIVTDTTVRVDMILEEEVRKFIKKDARATIGSEGLMGNKIMNISPGSSGQQPIQDNDFIATKKPFDFDEMLNKVRLTTDNALAITSDLSAIMRSIRYGKGTIGKLFMDSGFARNLDKTIINVKQGTQGFNQNMEAAKNSFFLRGYFKKQEKKALKEKEEKQKEKDKNNPEKKKKRKGFLFFRRD